MWTTVGLHVLCKNVGLHVYNFRFACDNCRFACDNCRFACIKM